MASQDNKPVSRRVRRLLERCELRPLRLTTLANGVSLAAFLIALFTLLFSASKGFDITDESYYLLWAAQPQNIVGSSSHFGYITGILYQIAGQNIALFRALGIIILLAVALAFALAAERYWRHASSEATVEFRFSGIMLILSGSLLFYPQRWILTPSYNWLALVSVFMVATGLLAGHAPDQRTRRSSWYHRIPGAPLLVGAGGSLAFLAKPTTALMLALLSLFWVVAQRRTWSKAAWFLVVAGLSATATLGLHAWAHFGGPRGYYQDILDGLSYGATLGGGHNMTTIVARIHRELSDFIVTLLSVDLFLVAAPVFGLLLGLRFWPAGMKFAHWTAYALLAMFLFWWLALISAWSGSPLVYHLTHGLSSMTVTTGPLSVPTFDTGTLLMSLLLPFAGLSLAIHWTQGKPDEKLPVGHRHMLLVVILAFLLSFAYAFGSNMHILRQMSGSVVFLVAALFYLGRALAQSQRFHFVPKLLAMLLSILVLLAMRAGYDEPSRIESIGTQRIAVSLLSSSGRLHVDEATANYIHSLQEVALHAGWKEGTPLVDTTGGSPGALVILNARLLGKGWLLGRYPGSDAYAEKALGSVSPDLLREAWVLTTTPDAMRRLSDSVLQAFPLDFPARYEMVGEVKTGHRNEVQFLWKPRRI